MKLYVQPTKDVAAESHPARGAWIEIDYFSRWACWLWSHPARGAWIEIQISRCKCCPGPVAPRKGCVD